MSESQFTVYACCPRCRGVVGALYAPDAVDAQRDEVVVTDAGFRPYVTGPGATEHFAVGYRLQASCAYSHEFAVSA